MKIEFVGMVGGVEVNVFDNVNLLDMKHFTELRLHCYSSLSDIHMKEKMTAEKRSLAENRVTLAMAEAILEFNRKVKQIVENEGFTYVA